MTGKHSGLLKVLERAQDLGLVGPGPVLSHVEHAEHFFGALEHPPSRALDLGSGAGLPGLMLALAWPDSSWILLDAGERRAAFLDSAVEELGLQDRVSVAHGRAETLARDHSLRGAFDLVTARGFGSPAITAECASGFLIQSGSLLVSEPPEAAGRWDDEQLSVLGLRRVEMQDKLIFRADQFELTPDRYPRRVGIPAKRPLF